MPAAKKEPTQKKPQEAALSKRAASRGFTLVKEGNVWYAEISDTRWGPMATLDEVDEFLPKDD